MKKILTIVVLAVALFATAVNTQEQTAPKKVYNEEINPLEQIDQAVAQAHAEGKYVICQVGGNWCPWCLRFADFITNDSTINAVIEQNFVFIHVNYHPRMPGALVSRYLSCSTSRATSSTSRTRATSRRTRATTPKRC